MLRRHIRALVLRRTPLPFQQNENKFIMPKKWIEYGHFQGSRTYVRTHFVQIKQKRK